MKIRITYYGALGTIYSVIEDWDAEDIKDVDFGDWTTPFPNEKDNSTAFGLEECLAQSRRNPFGEEEIERIKVEKL